MPSDDRYRTLVEEIQDYAIFMLDPQGRVASWNRGAERVLGYSESDILGLTIHRLFTPEDNERGVPQRELDKAAATGRASDDLWHLRKDGRRIWVSGVTTALRDENGEITGFAKIIRDMTAIRATEDRLSAQYATARILAESLTLEQAAPQLLKTLCDQMGWSWGAMWAVDTAEQVLRCVQFYEAKPVPDFREISRKTTFVAGVGLPGRVWASSEAHWIPDVTKDANFPRAPIAEGVGLHGAVGFPIQLGQHTLGAMEFLSPHVQQPDENLLGMMRWVGSQIGQFLQRRVAEQRLRLSEARKSAILEAALDCIISMDHQGKVVEWNPAAERTFGYTGAEAIGQALANLIIPPSLREAHWKGLARYLETGEGPVIGRRIELTAVRSGGAEFPVELAITRIELPGPPVFTAYLRDITQRKQNEQEIVRLLERERDARGVAESANRAKDEFLATVSHELRTPLTAIVGWSRLLRDDPQDPQLLLEGLSVIDRNAKAQSQLVDDLLDISRIISGKLRLRIRPMNLCDVIHAAADTVRPAANAKGIEIQIDAGKESGPVSGDPDRLQQVVWNLLSNAIKFTDRGGRVSVRLDREHSVARITVRDTGRGITADFLPYVFQRFQQADAAFTRKTGGLGLGLSIVRHLVELHGGTVTVQSEGEAKGTSFIIRLPLLTIHMDERAAEQSSAGSTARGETARLAGIRILIVDDEPDTRRLLANVLKRCGAEVSTASSAAEAMVQVRSRRFDIMLTDIGMPDEDGYALLGQLRALPSEQGGGTSAVALTAYARDLDRERALRAGFNDFIAKPVEPADLVEKLAHAAGRG